MEFRVVLLGPPGAGKGTHARILSERYSLSHLSTGDLLRSHIRSGTPLGKRAKSFVDNGKLVPDELVIEMVKDKLQSGSISSSKGFILDGFPRTSDQAHALEKMLNQVKRPINLVLEFNTTEPMIIERLSGRRACTNCSANYHVRNIPPKQDGICDRCGSALIQRPDDQPATVRERLKIYRASTQPIVDFYKERGVFHTVNGDLEVTPLQKELEQYFSKS